MVRRSTVDRSPQPDLYGTAPDPGAGNQQAGTGKRPRSGPGWRGAGGRWLVWTFRVVVWAVLLIIGYRGVMAIVLNETPPSHTPPAPATSTPGFPVQEASAYAMQFGQVYLNASPATAGQRARELAPFLPPGTPDQQLGWNGGGSLNLQSEQVAHRDRPLRGHGVVEFAVDRAQNVAVLQLWQEFLDGIIQPKFAFFDEDHRGD